MVSAFMPLCVVAGLVLLIGLVGQYEPVTLESQTTIRGGGAETSEPLIPQTYKVSEFTSTAASQSIEAESYKVVPWHMPDLPMHADATSQDVLVVKRWEFDRDISINHAFGSNGDLFASGGYKVAQIDVSENTQTIWTLPTNWSIGSHFTPAVSPSGVYYFADRGGYLASLDPTTGTFTRWNIDLGRNSDKYIHSSSDGIYFVPYHPIYIAESRNPQITGIYQNDRNPDIRIYGSGASGLVNGELVLPSGEIYSGSTFAGMGGGFSIEFEEVFTSYSDSYYNRGVGNFTIRINDMFQTDEATFKIESHNSIRGSRGSSDTSSVAFLQKLDPSTKTITSFVSDVPNPSSHRLISHDLSDSLYFSNYDDAYRDGMTKFVPDSGEFTYWTSQSTDDDIFEYLDYYVLATSDEKIYWGVGPARHTIKIAVFNMNAGVISETAMPHRCTDRISGIAVGSSDTVYFSGCDRGFYKFTPSINTFTKFTTGVSGSYTKFLGTNSPNVVYWADGSRMGTASFIQILTHIPGTPVHLVGMISIPSGTSVPGCEENNECHIPADILVSVGDVVTWSNDDTAAHTITSGFVKDDNSGVDFDSGLMVGGTTFSNRFDEAGVYPYFCIVHPWKMGSVTVRMEEPPKPIVISGAETTSSTKIRMTTDHDLSGLPNVAEFSVSGNMVSSVVLSGVTITITLDTPILYSDVITISYSGSSIHSGGVLLDAFMDMKVTNNVIGEQESEQFVPSESFDTSGDREG